ncbi:hypothetical protein LCGC14_0910250 [marine sediment metagenome]|uniref:Uncharacterized protein n=1 Tax=marine sediment metagenome TaxID=412755 RepID=A0A0F9NTX0_9ZZZZ
MAKLYGALRGAQLATAIAGDGVEWTSDDILGLDLKASAGLKIDTAELAIEPADFAGTGLEDDGSDNLRLAVQGNGIAGGNGSTLSVDLDGSTLKVGASGVALADLTDTYILVGNGSNVATGVVVSGDVTISNLGAISIGATKVVDAMINDDVATGLAGDGISASGGVLALDLNELTAVAVDVSADSIAVLDATDGSSKKESIADLATAMAGSGITATAGVLSVDAISANIVEGDIQKEDESANCNGSNVAFTLSNTPIANSVQVFLNGQLMIEGSGKNYTISATTITFATAPASNDTLIVYYIIDN